MHRRRLLAFTAVVQLACNGLGLVTAVRRRYVYDLKVMHGRPDRIARDSIAIGTALSAPLTMMGAQALATNRLLSGESDGARKLLGGLGAVMVAGYLGEQHVRNRLAPAGRDPFETPLILVGMSSALLMVVLSGIIDG